MRSRPKVFVGSSVEHVPLVKHLNVLNEHSTVRYVPWTNLGVFEPGDYPMEALVRCLSEVDAAAFFFLGSDTTWWRGEPTSTPRDNVVFEAGLAAGTFGLTRTAIITDGETRLPSDLTGLTPVRLEISGDPEADASDLHARLERFFAGVEAHHREVRSLWHRDQYAIYFHSFENPERGEVEEIVNLNAVRAVARIIDYFGRTGIGTTLHSSRSSDLPIDNDLVLLGSDASNRLTRHLLAEIRDHLPFHCLFDAETMTQRRVTSSVSGKTYTSEVNDVGPWRDYGILTHYVNPFRRGASLIIAAGNYGYGTLGATNLALDGSLLTSVPVAIAKPCQIIVETPVLGKWQMGEPRVMEWHQLAVPEHFGAAQRP